MASSPLKRRPRILMVEDDPTVTDVLGRYLTRERFDVDVVANGREAVARLAEKPPDLVILDIMLPGISGLEICRRLRQRTDVPVILLSAKAEKADRIVGLELGADDYIVKPFSSREVVARVKAVLRRRQPRDPTTENTPITAGALVVDFAAQTLSKAGSDVHLTAREFELLVFLMQHPGQVFAREQLLERVWGYVFGATATVTVHVQRLRDKIELDPANPSLIKTVWGVGYRFDPGPDSPAAG